MRVDETQRIFTGNDQLSDQSVAFAQLDLLLCQLAKVAERFFPSPTLLQPAEQQMIVGIQTDLTAPLGKQQVVPIPRRIALGNQPRVIADDEVIVVCGSPVTLLVFPPGAVTFALGRIVGLD